MKVPISQVNTNDSNPRIIKEDKFKQLVKSIKEFPEMLELRPIVVDEDMIILGGNMRYRACLEAGLKEVSITIAEGLTEEQKREFIVKDNVGFGDWEWSMLANEWDNIKLKDWGLDVWQPDEIDDINFIDDISEAQNFIIKCDNEEQLIDIQERFNATGTKIKYETLIENFGS